MQHHMTEQTPVCRGLPLRVVPCLKGRNQGLSLGVTRRKRKLRQSWDEPVEVGGLWVEDVLALLSDGGRVVGSEVALRGLQRVVVALQVCVARGQGHEICAGDFLAVFHHFGIEIPAVFFRGGRVGHLDVGDAELLQDHVGMSQVHLPHVANGYSSVKGLLGTDVEISWR